MTNLKVSKRLEKIQEYVFYDLEKKVLDIEKSTGKKVLNFAIGNPNFPPNSLHISKLAEFIQDKSAHLYPGYGATSEFSQSLIFWYKKRFNVVLEKEELLPLLGAKDGVSHLSLALLDEGDEVLVPDPGYPAFSDPAKLVGAKIIYYNLLEKNNFQISLEELERKISNKTKFIWLNFPSNPTGQVITTKKLKEIVDIAKKHNILVVYDNAYSEITFDGFIAPSILEIEGAKELCVEIGSFSKTFSFAGFRMGWIVGNREVIRALAKIKSQMDSGLSTPLQKLGAFALKNFDESWHQKMIENYSQKREVIGKYLKTLGLQFSLPKGSLYIWAKIPTREKDSKEYCMRILREQQILFTPGVAFGKNGTNFIRVSISVNIDNIEDYFKS